MSGIQDRLDISALRTTVSRWLEKRLEAETFRQLEAKIQQVLEGAEDWELFSGYSSLPRLTGRDPLRLDSNEAEEADELRRGWHPSIWSIDQLSRGWLLLAMSEHGKEEFLEKIEKLFISGDMGEAVALYRCLPILPWPQEFRRRAAEGIRSNITSVFEAVALHNPYPEEYLDEDAWNQMVLKALFINSPLYKVRGIDRRANPTLARMLLDYAHERWSAGRAVSPELWRPVGPFVDQFSAQDLERVLLQGDVLEREAALLALSASDNPAAKKILEKQGEPSGSERGNPTEKWNGIGAETEKRFSH